MGILRSIFGPSKEEIWSQVADEINGEFIDGGFWGKSQLRYHHREWTIVLDVYNNSETAYTRLRAPFINKDGFHFKLYPESFFSTFGKALGMQDIEIGDYFFDNEFIIKSNSQEKVTKLLDSQPLRELIRGIPNIHFKISDDEHNLFGMSFPDGVDMLYFETQRIIKDKWELRNLFLLFCMVLERLVQLDSAYENDPNIELK